MGGLAEQWLAPLCRLPCREHGSDRCPGQMSWRLAARHWRGMMRLWSDCSHMKTKVAATNACGNTQLCAGLRSGGSRPTSTPSGPYGRSRQDGPRTAPRRRRTTGTRPVRLTCGAAFGPRVCSPPGLILGQLRMPHSPGTNRGLASALLSLTPATASMRSTATSCYGTWPTFGIGGADSHSTGTGTGSAAWSGRSHANQPS